MLGGEEVKGGPICTIAVSLDGQWLASGDTDNQIHIFNMDTLKYHTTLPTFDSQHTTFGFHHSGNTLVVVCASNRFYLYDVEEKVLSDWSREYGNSLPKPFLNLKERIVGVAFNPARASSIIFYSYAYFVHVDLRKPIPMLETREELVEAGKSTDSNRDTKKENRNFRLFTRFQPLLYLDFVGPNKLITVERPWLNVISHFPDPLHRKKYGT